MAQLIAICGVDGVGKSTLLRSLQAAKLPSNTAFLSKTFKQSVRLVESYYAESGDRSKDYNSGSFAKAIAYASCLDFLWHWENVIKPEYKKRQLVICDRYIPCYTNYLASVGCESTYKNYVSYLPKADLTILLDVKLSSLSTRYNQRGGPTEDENITLMAALRKSYLSHCTEYSTRVAVLNNDCSLQETVKNSLRLIDEIRCLAKHDEAVNKS